MFSLLGANLFSQISGFFQCIPEFLFNLIVTIIFVPLYFIFMGISTVSLFAETAFRKLAGIDTIYLEGTPFGGGAGGTNAGQDLVFAFIRSEAVQNVFWSILALSIVLLFIFTIVALVKSEFTLDLKGSAKGPIFSRAFKSLANFIIVPVVTLISIIGVNYITTSVYKMFSQGNPTTIVTKCFILGAYNANRVRRGDEDFYQFLNSGEYKEGGDNHFSGSEERVASAIDEAFLDFKDYKINFKDFTFQDMIDAKAEDRYAPFQTMILGDPNPTSFSIWHIAKVNYFYNLFYFDYILALGSAIVMAWTLLSVCLVLVKRVFEMTILFLLAPPMTAIAPLDGGQAEKKWRQEFLKRLLSVIASVFAYNMFFLLIPLFENISLFGASVKLSIGATYGSTTMLSSLQTSISDFTLIFNIFFQVVCILTGLSVIKSASALLSNLLGIEDLIKSGGESMKNAVATGQKAVGLATAVGGVALKGAAFAIRGTKNAVQGIGNKAGRLQNREDKAKAKLEKATEEAKAKGTLNTGGADDAHIADLQKKYDVAEEKNSNYVKMKGNKAGDKAVDTFIRKKQKVFDELEKEENNTNYKAGSKEEKKHNDRLNSLRKQFMDMGGHDIVKTEDLIDKATTESRQKAWYGIKENRDKPTGIWSGIKSAYNSEYGEDSGKTNLLGGIANNVNKWAEKTNIPIISTRLKKTTKSFSEYLNVDGATAVRRLNDMLGNMFGDGGGKALWEINFKGNARAALFEGVPEAKKRENKISQGILSEARRNWEKEEAEKALKTDKLRELAKYFAKENNDPKYRKLMEDRQEAEEMGNNQKVKEIDAKIDKFNIDSGYLAQARSALKDSAFMKSDKYKAFRNQIKEEAYKDEAEKERKDQDFTQQMAAKYGDKPQSVKKTSEEREKDKKDMIEAFKSAMKEGIKFDETSLESFKTAISQGGKDMASELLAVLKDALDKLK